MVFLSAIIHANSVVDNQNLVEKSYKALNNGGQIVIQDFIMDDDRVSPAAGAIFALNMLVGTSAGDTYTETEIRHWLTLAGFKTIIRLESVGPTSTMVGYK